MTTPIRVLVVEDNDSVMRLVEIVLGLEPDIEIVGKAASADEALASAASSRPSVVVLDNQMPGRAGLEITDEFRALGVQGVVVYSAESSVLLDSEAARAGAEVCPKTGDIQDLVAAIRRAAV